MAVKKPPSLVDAVRSGLIPGLEALRDKLAADLEIAEPAVAAQIAGRLHAVLDRLAELTPAQEETLDDVLAARRRARQSNAGRSSSAG